MSGRSHDTSTQAVGLPCRPDCTWQVAMSGKSRDTRTQAVSLPCRPDCTCQVAVSGKSHDTRTQASSLPARCTRQVAMSGKSCDTRTQAVFLAGQTALIRSPCQERATTHTGGLPCRPDRTWQVVVSGRSRDTDTHVANPVARSHSLIYCKLTSLDASSSKEL